jgi:hypothetical protein
MLLVLKHAAAAASAAAAAAAAAAAVSACRLVAGLASKAVSTVGCCPAAAPTVWSASGHNWCSEYAAHVPYSLLRQRHDMVVTVVFLQC